MQVGTRRIAHGAVHLLRILQRLTAVSARRGIPFAFPRRQWLARETGAPLRTVDRWLAELRGMGWLTCRRAKEVHGWNQYFLTKAGVRALSPQTAGVLLPETAGQEAPETAIVQPPPAAEAAATAPLEGLAKMEEAAMSEPAAAPVLTLLEAAERELRNCRVEDPAAGRLARADPNLVIVACAHFRCLQKQGKKTPGLLVKMCQDPRSFGFKRMEVAPAAGADPFEVWHAPEGSPVHAMRQKRQHTQRAAASKEALAAEYAAKDAAEKVRRVQATAAWAGLDDFERAGLEQAIEARFTDPKLARRSGAVFREMCEDLALEMVAACADLAQWQAVPEAERQAAEQLAAAQEPLFATDARRMLWLRWLALETVKRGAAAKRKEKK